MQVAVCKNARLVTCRSVVQFPGGTFQFLFFFSEGARSTKVLKNLPQPPTLHVALPDESV